MPKTKPVETYQVEVELTDTYGGEANYCWVRRATLTLPVGISNRAIMRRAKAAVGITGMRGEAINYGDTIDFRPYRACLVMFIIPAY